MPNPKTIPLLAATVVTALYIGGGGVAKLVGIPYFHSSFPELGLPPGFGYFIGICEVLGSIALFIRPLCSLAAAGLFMIMVGAAYYHVTFTPFVLAVPAFILAALCVYIFMKQRHEILKWSAA